MWSHVEDYVARNMPLMKEIEAWESLKPKGRSLEDYLDWYREFIRMGNDLRPGSMTEFQWMSAFWRVLMFKAQFEREFVKLKDRERQEGRELDLDECNAFIIQELRDRLEVQQYKALYGDRPDYPPRGRHGPYDGGYVRGMGGAPTCSHCLRNGHAVETCWFLHPNLKPLWSSSTPQYRGGRGMMGDNGPRPYRPPRSFSAPPPSRGHDRDRGKSGGKGKGKGKGEGKGRGKGKGDGKGKGKGKGKGPSEKDDSKRRTVGEVHVATPAPH